VVVWGHSRPVHEWATSLADMDQTDFRRRYDRGTAIIFHGVLFAVLGWMCSINRDVPFVLWVGGVVSQGGTVHALHRPTHG